ncbi:MAG: NAD(+) diphosphatase [Deferrisomatales bacterium]|nr:NAD(+) diphosphatase [Deferrisomatales bacterium]
MGDDAVQGRSGRNGFAALGLERHGERRGEAGWLAVQLDHPASRFYPVWGTRILVAGDVPRAVALSRAELGETLVRAEAVVFLGRASGVTYFAAGFSRAEAPEELAGHGRFVDLRGAASLLPAEHAARCAYALGMVTWHRTARFCGTCGAATESMQGGFVRRCLAPDCSREHFPRSDPAIIVLVERGEYCLLGRQGWWEPGRLSVLAGYVEPGETFEAAVAREVLEETGVEVTAVRYRSSQPWPFPGGIMVGFFAHGINREIELRDGELEEARWVSREQLARELKAGTLTLPYSVSIAYRLIEEWFDAAPGWRLGEWTGEV